MREPVLLRAGADRAHPRRARRVRQRVKRLLRQGLPLPSALQYRARPLAWLVPRCEARDENNVVPACDRACFSQSAPPFARLRMRDPHGLLETVLLRSRSHPLGSDASTKSSFAIPQPRSALILLTGYVHASEPMCGTSHCEGRLPEAPERSEGDIVASRLIGL
jgi:hypothetical protein